jgi:hypothetical protein
MSHLVGDFVNGIKVSNSQSLFVSPSLVTGLYTNTKTKTTTGSTSIVTALGSVYMRAVLKDSAGNVVKIGYPVAVCNSDILGCQSDANNHFGVILDSRVQTLSQSLSDCVVNVGTSTGTCTFDSTIGLMLQQPVRTRLISSSRTLALVCIQCLSKPQSRLMGLSAQAVGLQSEPQRLALVQ